jgi:hypothetical protein
MVAYARTTLLLVLLGSLVGPTLAQEKPAAGDALTAAGKVTALDRERGELVLTNDGGTDLKFTMDKNATIRWAGKDGSLRDVRDGAAERVTYLVRDGKRIVSELHGGIEALTLDKDG